MRRGCKGCRAAAGARPVGWIWLDWVLGVLAQGMGSEGVKGMGSRVVSMNEGVKK